MKRTYIGSIERSAVDPRLWVMAQAVPEWFWAKVRFARWNPVMGIAAGVMIVIVLFAILYFSWKFIVGLIQS